MLIETVAELLRRPVPGEDAAVAVTVHGWIRSRRDSKAGLSFLDVSDGSDLRGIQVVADADLAEYETVVRHLHLGCSVRIAGNLVASRGQGQAVEVRAGRVELLGDCDPETYPIQKQATSLEHLRTIPHLRGRTRTFQAIMRVRDRLAAAVHRFFHRHGFVWLHTPIITAADCEGAGSQFRVTTLDPDAPPRAADGRLDESRDFFARRAWLTVSGQLEGETYACGLGRIYTFGPTFRAEDSHTTRHLSEFWMIEPEVAFCDLDGNRALAADFVRAVLGDTLADCAAEIEALEKLQARGLRAEIEGLATARFVHCPYTEAIERLKASGKRFEHPPRWGADLQTEHERFLTEQVFRSPVVVTDYPKDIKAFYMRLNDDGKTVAAMDVLLPKVGELIGGSQREERLDVLDARLTECGLAIDDYGPYRDLRRFGTVPHAGFGLGFERLVCLATGSANIRDVIPYPRTPGSCP